MEVSFPPFPTLWSARFLHLSKLISPLLDDSRALYLLVLSSEGPRYGMLLGRYANLVFRKIKAVRLSFPFPSCAVIDGRS
jgi:hypothetical protein